MNINKKMNNKNIKKIAVLLMALMFTGCLDFTRYKTGKVLKTGENKIVLGEPIVLGNDKGIGAVPVPKIAYSVGSGKGYEVGITFNLISLSLELRKQLLYEEKTGINMTLDGSLCTGGSCSGGFTASKSLKNGKEPYIGVRYNKYADKTRDEEEVVAESEENVDSKSLDRYDQISSVQLTTGIKVPINEKLKWYTEMNIYRYTEEHERLGNDALVLFGTGIAIEWK